MWITRPTVQTCGWLILGAMTLFAESVQADPALEQRCSLDSLDAPKAEQRLEWARKCALTLHTNGPSDYVPTGELDINGNELMEYLDDKYQNRNYTGTSDFWINHTFRHNLYGLGGTEQILDPLNYYKWTKTTKKPRPNYPTFGDEPNIYSGTNDQLYPHPTLANCNLYYNTMGSGAPATNFYVNGYCQSSCYTPEQEVLFPDGYQRIDEAVATLRPRMITLTPDSTLDDMQFMTNGVSSYTMEIRDAEHVIFEVKTASGGSLRVTDQHPVLLGDGRLVQANSLRVGQPLIREDGELDPIVSIHKVQHHGKVYNIKPETLDPVSNILVAQGYLVGSSSFQNDDIGYINRIILRRGIPEALLPK